MSEQEKKNLEENIENQGPVEEIFAEEETSKDVNELTNEDEQSMEELTPEQEQLKEAEAKIAELEAKIEELENRYLRLQADFENSRRRARLDMEAAQKYRVQNLATDLLQSLDNFERALNIKTENEETKSILKGMEMVYKGIMDALKREGVEPIESVGQPFDPYKHQAVMQVQEEGYDSNVVIEELQKGYMLKDRVIRPAMVKVNG